MIKIKHKIAIPFMAIIVIMPLAAMLMFNIIMRAYVYATAKEELKNAAEATNFILKQQTARDILENQDQARVAAVLPKLKAALKTSRIATKTEIIILGKQERLVYPRTFPEDSFLNDKIIEAVQNIDFSKTSGAQRINAGGKSFLAARHPGKQAALNLIYILSMEDTNAIIRLVNLVLVYILAAATVIGLILSLFISRGISKPIDAIAGAARKIGRGQFVTIEPMKTSEEIFELSRSINAMSANLDRLEKSRSVFLQNASHELRTPLMSIQGYAEGIMKGVFADNAQAAGIIRDESIRLTSLVEQLLALSRIENNTYRAGICKINLNNMMRDFVQRIDGLAIKNNKQILLKEECPEISALADEELLLQAAGNIVSNSIRFAKSRVEISLYKEGGNACIKISDDGGGISEADLPRIFDRFYKGKGGNFGLGLAIAKSAVDVMKGGISVRNSEAGAEFQITLPAADQTAEM